MSVPQTKPSLLSSWKEIANYLGRGVRTVQRWERMGLPVHRVGSGARCPVQAYVRDIDLWLKARPQANKNSPIPHSLHEAIVQSRALRHEMATLREDDRALRQQLVDKLSRIRSSSRTFCGNSTWISPKHPRQQ